jgi:hypothetical protein
MALISCSSNAVRSRALQGAQIQPRAGRRAQASLRTFSTRSSDGRAHERKCKIGAEIVSPSSTHVLLFINKWRNIPSLKLVDDGKKRMGYLLCASGNNARI